MSGFVPGVLFGVGLGLVIAPMRGEETRRILNERLQELRTTLSENEQWNQYTKQFSSDFSQVRKSAGGWVQLAVNQVVGENSAAWLDLAQSSINKVMDGKGGMLSDLARLSSSKRTNASNNGSSLSDMLAELIAAVMPTR